MGELLARVVRRAYLIGIGPKPSDRPDQDLIEYVAERGDPGGARALDLGCASGRNSHYLAAHGWDTTGVDLAAGAVERARRRAEAADVPARYLVGDVSRLSELDLVPGFALFVDGGCFHLVPPDRRDDYVSGVTGLAAPGALLLVSAFTRGLGPGLSPAELAARFAGWEVLQAAPIRPDEMLTYVAGPPLARYAIRRNWFRPWRYRLRRVSDS